jgi:MEMO1 family protein
MESTRPAAVSGLFYARDARTLRGDVERFLRAAETPAPSRRPKLLVVPHAGFVYSGPVAATAYMQLAPWAASIRRVVLLGPAHRVAVHGLAAPTVDSFTTPLGTVPLDTAALASIADLPQVQRSDLAHADEHALEVQLPFLQTVLGDAGAASGRTVGSPPVAGFQLVPLVVGSASPDEVAQVLERLWCGDETLIVISSDLSHYLDDARARARDRRTVERIAALSTDLDPHDACGAHALNGAMQAARRHGLRGRLLDLRNSGDTGGGRDRVVGYGALAFATNDVSPVDGPSGEDEARLGDALLARARNTIARLLGAPAIVELDHPALREPGATFVTVRAAGGELRGCIGRLTPERALADDVRRNAEAAATRDPRFPPLQPQDWAGLQVEVSLLSAPEPLPRAGSLAEAAAALDPGVDGVILDTAGRQATFLPQVWEQLPDPSDFLDALLRKAGVPPGRWPGDITLQRYRVRKFERATLAA